MNPIVKAISDLSYKIPIQILQLAFQRDEWNQYNPNVSLDEQIRIKVVNPRVLFDCNMVGGQQVLVSLAGLQPISSTQNMVIYQIPLERTGNRTIVSVLSVSFAPFDSVFDTAGGLSPFASAFSSNSLANATQRIADASSLMPVVSNAQVELVGHNTVVIHENRITSSYYLRCLVENEENLNNIHPRSIYNLSKLVELAVKSYIYNKLIIRIDQAYIQGGQEIGRVKEVVDSYADSEEMYQTQLTEVWAKVSIFNDNTTSSRLLRLSISPGL